MPGFFVDDADFRLPHPPVPLRVILIIHIAIRAAFQSLRAHPPEGFSLSSATEDQITVELYRVLEDRLLGRNIIPGFDRRRFRNVVRAPEVPNFDGKHPAKRPDLVAFLMQRERPFTLPSQDALFAECKPVDESHPIGTDYCDRGIQRFICGDYGWAMQDAIMVGYVRGTRTILAHLAPVLASESRYADLGSPTSPRFVVASHDAHEPLQFTSHNRRFIWPQGQGPACKIQIFHSWHSCD